MPEAPSSTDALAACQAQVEACLRVLDVPGAVRAAQAALAAAEADDVQRAHAQYWLARVHYVAGEIDLGIVLAAEASAAALRIQDPVLLARSQTTEARCLEQAGESHAALDLVLLALQALEESGRQDEATRAAQQSAELALGVVHLSLGDAAQAMHWCRRSAELARAAGRRGDWGVALDTLACVHSALASQSRQRGDAAEAERQERQAIALSREAVDCAREVGDTDHETTALLNLVESLTLVGEPLAGLALLEDWTRRHPHALPRHWSHQRDSLGYVYLALDRVEDAVKAFEQAVSQAEVDGYRIGPLESLALALERCGRHQEALAHYKRFHALHARVNAERAQRSARVAVARLDIERERARARQLANRNAELSRRADDLARQASEDALTGLPNRRRVDEALVAWPRPLWVALLDVDHFKRVNDDFSHAVGDEVLRQLGRLLRTSCRPQDLAARLGGEEFVVLFEGGADAEVARAAERLRLAVETFDWSTVVAGLRVTVSIGLAGAGEVGDAQALLELADRRLYAAKRGGRNRTVGPDC